MSLNQLPLWQFGRSAMALGSAASTLSAAAMAWRSKRDTGSAVAGMNAPSHWLHGREALHADEPDLQHTGVGGAIHWASSLLWGGLYQALRSARRQPTPANAVTDAIAVSALSAVVDLKLVPERLTPGFQHRLRPSSLALVYGSFAVGLVLVGMSQSRR
jgi:hypothetical protein